MIKASSSPLKDLMSKALASLLSVVLLTMSFDHAFALAIESRIEAWRAIARPVGGVAPDFLKGLNIAPERLDSFLRVLARTGLGPQSDVSETQIREAVATYA